jgi:hypothetical protein
MTFNCGVHFLFLKAPYSEGRPSVCWNRAGSQATPSFNTGFSENRTLASFPIEVLTTLAEHDRGECKTKLRPLACSARYGTGNTGLIRLASPCWNGTVSPEPEQDFASHTTQAKWDHLGGLLLQSNEREVSLCSRVIHTAYETRPKCRGTLLRCIKAGKKINPGILRNKTPRGLQHRLKKVIR